MSNTVKHYKFYFLVVHIQWELFTGFCNFELTVKQQYKHQTFYLYLLLTILHLPTGSLQLLLRQQNQPQKRPQPPKRPQPSKRPQLKRPPSKRPPEQLARTTARLVRGGPIRATVTVVRKRGKVKPRNTCWCIVVRPAATKLLSLQLLPPNRVSFIFLNKKNCLNIELLMIYYVFILCC